ncbi:UDP-N-acetylmuramate--L-alanine ligase [Paenibacillus flagellatus]|uniref:UDP-N-acetylmuramate--L-alanine ligase n=1 Tax=Paenibacillus flagellatus TaxID=2211139 RepID=A0A2V5JZD5_9BACL|nr:UDP-N-acetylmuramate--L-alanine ligase [Paenibacillus flagellatus]PYI52218.1 UDP-N-acetylmuramate--L-alanine ligase [Paenibacillus flagellatus]
MNTTEHVHFIGIGGYGMSAIAKVMLEMGYRVSGSDLAGQELTEKLAAKGAQVFIGHEASHVRGADVVVYSTALPKDNVEIAEAQRMNIPILHRSQMLARLMESRKGVAVAGAHGKTTTTSMISLVMEECGLDPTYIIGGEILNVGSNAKAGGGDYVVAEADESDGSFLQYRPLYAVVTNIEADHLENYDGDFGKLKKAYAQFLGQVAPGGKAVVCTDDPDVREVLASVPVGTISYGLEPEADYRAVDIRLGDRRVAFDVVHEGRMLGTVELSVPGRHNVYNALAAFIVCREAGVPFADFARAIKLFRGAKRRFQVLADVGGILVIDDYAHHPTEIQATISAAKATGKRIIAVFQPQRYTRTYFLFEPFSRAFGEADEVIIADIYSPAGERQIEGVSSEKLVELIRSNSNARVRHISSVDEVTEFLRGFAVSGDLVLTMGAGDIWKASHALAKTLNEREAQPPLKG